MPGAALTNRHLLVVRLLAHIVMFYVWAPAAILHAISMKLQRIRAMCPTSLADVQQLWRSTVILLNHKLAAACEEGTAPQWMQDVFLAPDVNVALCLVFAGDP